MLKLVEGGARPPRKPKLKTDKPLPLPRDIIQAGLLVRGITRVRLAAETGLSKAIVYGVVSGNRTCSDVAGELERALNIPAGRLIEMELALTRRAIARYTEAIRREREETYSALPLSWRGAHLKVVDGQS